MEWECGMSMHIAGAQGQTGVDSLLELLPQRRGTPRSCFDRLAWIPHRDWVGCQADLSLCDMSGQEPLPLTDLQDALLLAVKGATSGKVAADSGQETDGMEEAGGFQARGLEEGREAGSSWGVGQEAEAEASRVLHWPRIQEQLVLPQGEWQIPAKHVSA